MSEMRSGVPTVEDLSTLRNEIAGLLVAMKHQNKAIQSLNTFRIIAVIFMALVTVNMLFLILR